MLFKLSFQSILYRRKQYISLLLVCIFGTAISLSTLFIVNGMMTSLKNKAKIYYGGDYHLLSGKKSSKNQMYVMDTDADSTIEKLQKIFPENSVISKRFDMDCTSAAFYYEGETIKQRVIKGVDFEKEAALFETLNFVEGSYKDMPGTNGVLISEPISKNLGIQIGDTMTLSLKDANYNVDTIVVEVKGIFRDSSLFGMYTSYMNLDSLQKVFKLPENYANRICITLPKNVKDSQKANEKYQAKLEEVLNMHKQVSDKQVYYNKVKGSEEKMSLLVPLDTNLLDLKIIIEAMKLITICMILSLSIIIIAGVSCTFRVIIMKRINEIGIYKAIGIHKFDIIKMMFYETVLIMAIGFAGGLILCGIICLIISKINLSFIPAFDVFLSNGCIIPQFSLLFTGILMILLFTCTMMAVLKAVKKPVQIMPCNALSVTE